ncbi:MAG: hypothetical protein QOE22_501 [Candidatus Parcubacteria bacterium]|jgi:hypothetical protein|nr:hypothetical protein [Candidatus Parcubacteria bacterium]
MTDPAESKVTDQQPFAFVRRLPKRTLNLLALLVIVAVLAVAYFIGSAAYYRVHPLGTDSGLSGTPYGSEDNAAFYEEFIRQFGAADTISCDDRYAQGWIDNEIYTAKIDDNGLCQEITRQGKTALRHLVYLGTNYSQVGVGTFVSGNKTYLVDFEVMQSDTSSYIQINKIVELKDVGDISSLSIVPDGERYRAMRLAGTDLQGKRFERYLTIYSHRYVLTFVTPAYRDESGNFSQQFTSADDPEYPMDTARVSFVLPGLSPVGESWGDRDTQLESETSVTPLYHKQLCGLEETYADMDFGFGAGNTGVSIKLQPGVYPKLNATTPREGYVPEDWGKVLTVLTPAEFREQVSASGTRNSHAASKMLTIEGMSVKFIGPLKGLGTCSDYRATQIQYEYQAVKGNAVVSFIFSDYPQQVANEEALTAQEREHIVAAVLRTIAIEPK